MIASPGNGKTDFIIELRETRTVIGKIGVWQGNEIGFMIIREHWRKGLVSEAMKALLPYYFKQWSFEIITADVDPRNEGSIALLTRFGFRKCGRREKTFEIGGVWVDSLDFELSREEWEKNGG